MRYCSGPKLISHTSHTMHTLHRVPTQISFSNSLCFPCFFPVRPQIFPVPIYLICDYYIHKTDLAKFSTLKNKLEVFRNFRSKNLNICYLSNQGIYNLSKLNSLCFGKISKFPVFSLTRNFFGHFPCFPCAVGTLTTVSHPKPA